MIRGHDGHLSGGAGTQGGVAAQFRHSTEMSGGRLSDDAEHDLAEYVRGEVDEAEMLHRARAQFGLGE